jgi:two-component system OmpR family sensor kinase
MKGRLFWKILIAFWITFVLITQGIWLLFTLLDPGEQTGRMRAMARMTVAAATSAIHEGGEPALQNQLKTWPHDQRRQVVVQPEAQPYDGAAALAQDVAAAPDGKRYRAIYLAPQTAHVRSLFSLPREVLIGFGIGGLIFSAILAWYLTAPVRLMQGGFGRLAQGDFTPRLGPAMGRRRDEIADLAHDFDSMAMRLEELVAARDRLLADVSHELRTPLARLNLAIGLARQDPARLAAALDRIGIEAGKLDEMVGELLTLARLESGHKPAEEYFDFAEVVKAVVQDARYEAEAKHIQVLLSVEPGDDGVEWIAPGSGRLVARAVENIVRNALRYSPDGGDVAVELRRADGAFVLCVADEGPGVPDADMAALFRPFGVSADGSGFGLGLAIARRAIAVQGGEIVARNRKPRGLEMQVTLPAFG